jgi:hypothetical protein
MISLSSSIASSLFYVGVRLTGEFSSLEELPDDSDIAKDAVSSADRPDFVGSERQIESREPTRKFRLLNVRSIS